MWRRRTWIILLKTRCSSQSHTHGFSDSCKCVLGVLMFRNVLNLRFPSWFASKPSRLRLCKGLKASVSMLEMLLWPRRRMLSFCCMVNSPFWSMASWFQARSSCFRLVRPWNALLWITWILLWLRSSFSRLSRWEKERVARRSREL